MCGRYTLRSSPKAIAQEFGLFDAPDLPPRYNIAPGQPVAVIRQLPEMDHRELAHCEMGFDSVLGYRPHHRKSNGQCSLRNGSDQAIVSQGIQGQTVLLVADGFYEWQKTDGRKQPYHFHFKNDHPFGIAGLWERWEKAISQSSPARLDDRRQRRDEANPRKNAGHHSTGQVRTLARPNCQDAKKLEVLLRPFSGEMTANPVSTVVNNPRNESVKCIEPEESLF